MVNVELMQPMLVQPLLAQVNFGGTWSSILGIALAGSGVALYALRSMRPKLARDHDIFFAAVALLCGGILFFQGWRQDPILQFGQFLLTASAVFFAIESIRLRGIATEQAKRNAPLEDFDRPVSRVYQAELDDEALNPYEGRAPRRRIQASREARPEREERDEDLGSRRSARRSSVDDRNGSNRARTRRTRPASEPGLDNYPPLLDDDEFRDDRPARTRGTSTSRTGNSSPGSPRTRRPRSTEEPPLSPRDRSRTDNPSPSEYVDYRPVDDYRPIDRDDDNWGDEY